MDHHLIGSFEKVHGPQEYPKPLRLLVTYKVFLGIPFLKKIKFVFILDILTKVAAQASLFRPHGADQ
ncbi:MAG TPA: hypothetical protein VLZ10_16370 [Thermodesulfobacteriota bacterium]|nr:hypothetical protein [Thermodesulfobacteriota bacterium]